MSEVQFDAIIKLIMQLPLYTTGILAGSSSREERVQALIKEAREILVEGRVP